MAKILTLTKKSTTLTTEVVECVEDVWDRLNGIYDPNIAFSPNNRDFVLLTDKKGNTLIISKRYLWKIEK